MQVEYQQDLEHVEILPHEEAVSLYALMKKGDVSARNKLVESCLRLSYKIARKFECCLEEEDRISEASIAVVDAVEVWEPEKGRLTSIVAKYVLNHLKEVAWQQGHNGVYIPLRTLQQIDRVKQGESVEDIVAPMQNMQERRRQDITGAVIASQISSLNVKSNDDDEYSLQPFAREEKNPDIPDICIADIEILFTKKKDSIKAQDRDIFRRLYGFNKPSQTINKIAEVLHITIGEVRKSLKNTNHQLQQRKKCKVCEEIFKPSFPFTIYCSKECRDEAEYRKKRKKFKQRKCEYCGKDFAPTKGNHIFCSLSCSRSKELMRKKASSRKRNKMCKICGKPFNPIAVSSPVYCSKYCRSIRNKKILTPVKCQHCDKDFVPSRSNQIFCSEKCNRAKTNLDKRTQRQQRKIQHECKICGKKFYQISSSHIYCSQNCVTIARREKKQIVRAKQQIVVIKKCDYCGDNFVPSRSSRQIFCSKKCSRNYWNENKKAERLKRAKKHAETNDSRRLTIAV